jgi:hypothetical protein
MKVLSKQCIVGALLSVALCGVARAGGFHLDVGLSYANGIQQASDKVFDLYEQAGFNVHDRYVVPVGVTVSPYYEFDMGLGVGLSLGPTSFIFVHEEFPGGNDEDKSSAIIPIGADVRYTFLRDKSVSPYLRVGVRYPIITGDFLDSSRPGPFGAVGVEIWRKKAVGFGFEIGYDASEVTVKGPTSSPTKNVTFAGFMVSAFAVF